MSDHVNDDDDIEVPADASVSLPEDVRQEIDRDLDVIERDFFDRLLDYFGMSQKQHHSENVPRDDHGRWTEQGGYSAWRDPSGGELESLPEQLTNLGPYARGDEWERRDSGLLVRRSRHVDPDTMHETEQGVEAVPKEDLDLVRDVPVYIHHSDGDFGGGGGLYGLDEDNEPLIRTAKYWDPSLGRNPKAMVENPSLQRTVIHEIGHAVDHAASGGGIEPNLHLEQGGRLWGSGIMRPSLRELKTGERRNAVYYLGDNIQQWNNKPTRRTQAETFAETFALAHAPDTERNAGRIWYGGMDRERATRVFRDPMEWIKDRRYEEGRIWLDPERALAVRKAAPEPTDQLLDNGWFVNTYGDVFAIHNGVLVPVDVSNVPEMQGLPYGSYTREQMAEIVGSGDRELGDDLAEPS